MTFEQIFRREKISPVYVEGDAFHRWNRIEMREQMKEAGRRGDNHYSHFGPQANLFEELEKTFATYSESGGGRTRSYAHDSLEAEQHNCPAGTFTPWRQFEPDSDLLFYEGLHGAVVTDKVNLAQYVDLKIGVVPVINLEWIQKLHRDRASRGYSTEAVTDTILRRMPDYINYICPQFTETDINFQRVPTVDTSNPFIARWIPTPDESMVVIRFRDPHGIDFPYLLSMIHGSFMSRANSIVIPGGKLDIAMQLILTPMILKLVERRRRALRA
jgi:phosphoribulokinase